MARVPRGLFAKQEDERWVAWSAVHKGPYAVVRFSDYGEPLLQSAHVFWDRFALGSYPPQFNVAVPRRHVGDVLHHLWALLGPREHLFPPHEVRFP